MGDIAKAIGNFFRWISELLGFFIYLIPAGFSVILYLIALLYLRWDWRWVGLFLAIVASTALLWWFFRGLAKGDVAKQLQSEYEFNLAKFRQGLAPLLLDPEKLFKATVDILDRLQKRINDEYGDIGARIGWLMTAQGLLFGAFVQVVKWDEKAADVQPPLLFGVAAFGVIISLTLSHSVFFGHEIAGVLKRSRSQIETEALTFGMPRTGVPFDSGVHRLSHMATKLLPVTTLALWLALGTIASQGILSAKHVATVEPVADCCHSPPLPPPTAIGWEYFKASPSFDSGNAVIPQSDTAWEVWASETVQAWRDRKQSNQNDSMIITGMADRVQLLPDKEAQFGSNMGLARARAEAVRRLLAGVCVNTNGCVWSNDRVVIETLGPGYTPPGKKVDGQDWGSEADRRVYVRSPLKQ